MFAEERIVYATLNSPLSSFGSSVPRRVAEESEGDDLARAGMDAGHQTWLGEDRQGRSERWLAGEAGIGLVGRGIEGRRFRRSRYGAEQA